MKIKKILYWVRFVLFIFGEVLAGQFCLKINWPLEGSEVDHTIIEIHWHFKGYDNWVPGIPAGSMWFLFRFWKKKNNPK